jgi:RNA polymerase sigma-70 factor (ECF subfamily)
MTDGELLESYIRQRDEAAFEALLRRHGPMVLGVCRRILHNAADAEDAFQATFLVLVRKAASVMPRALVGNWLYGVAHNTAIKAKAMNSRRRTKESQAAQTARPDPEGSQQLQATLDEELSRLPEKYRAPIVLCELEGRTLKEVARHLGWPQGTVAGRLARARVLLTKRLAQRGLALPVGALAAALAEGAASAAVPNPVVVSTLKAAALVAAGQAAAPGVISPRVAALTEGVLKAMLLCKLKSAMVLLLTACILVGALFLLASPVPAPGQTPGKEKEPQKSPAKQANKWPGEWLLEGDADRPCAAFQNGRVLLLVNEEGEFATGRITEANKLVILKGMWEEGLVGELVDDGKTIAWANGTKWRRP